MMQLPCDVGYVSVVCMELLIAFQRQGFRNLEYTDVVFPFISQLLLSRRNHSLLPAVQE
jgi:hypothetical protein